MFVGKKSPVCFASCIEIAAKTQAEGCYPVRLEECSFLSQGDGEEISYEKLILATGSNPVVPGWLKGAELENVYTVPKDLIYLEAMDDYVMIYTEGQRYMKQRSLKYYEEHLNPSDFVRVHRSYIIRISQISRLEQYEKESYKLTLVNNSQVPVSKSGYKRLKEVLRF